MPTDDWERGYAAGYHYAMISKGTPSQKMEQVRSLTPKEKKPRKASAYNKRYGAAFKRLAPKYKKKNGQWKKDGFKRCGAAARREAKR